MKTSDTTSLISTDNTCIWKKGLGNRNDTGLSIIPWQLDNTFSLCMYIFIKF